MKNDFWKYMDKWLSEIENFSTRSERMFADGITTNNFKWVRQAFEEGLAAAKDYNDKAQPDNDSETDDFLVKYTQDDLDALWLASRIDISGIEPGSGNLRAVAQLRLQRLKDMGIINHGIGYGRPTIVERKKPV